MCPTIGQMQNKLDSMGNILDLTDPKLDINVFWKTGMN